MYICVFSRSEGAGRATTRNTRGLTRSVIALMVPPFPAPSRPSNTRMMRRPLYLTQSWSLQSPTCNFRSSFAYSLLLIFGLSPPLEVFGFFIICPARLRTSLLAEPPCADREQNDRER